MSQTDTVRVLLVEDDRDDYLLTRDLLADVPGKPFDLDWAADYEAGLEALEHCEHDVCLLDYRLGARTGLDLLREATVKGCEAAVIFLTGQADPEIDRAAMAAGAVDFLEKDQLNALLLERAIRYAVQQKRHADELERLVAERTAELAAANVALKDADHRKDQFLATLAHELRNPLAPLRNGLHIMRTAEDATVVEQTRAMMERQLGQMVHLIDDLLDVSRIATGKLELDLQRVELKTVLDSAVETSRPLIEAKAHELTVALPSRPIYVNADLTRLAQVFLNLLNNAATYSKPSGQIWLSAELEDGRIAVSVRDTGIGIPAEMLPRVFDMFMQVDRSLERAQGGLGIGLTLVNRLTEMHGGTVEARSAGPGSGCEFIVRLPVAPSVVQETTRPDAIEPLERSARRRVLVVDDNTDAASSLAQILSLMGHDTRTASDGAAALEAAESYLPEVVLLDIGLPKLNGFEVARQLRAQAWGESMMLIALTGWGQDEDMRRSGEAGFDHHLVKPIDVHVVQELLARTREFG